MKSFYPALSAVVLLLTACNQTPPATERPTAAPVAEPATAVPPPTDTALVAPRPTATAPAAPAATKAQTLRLSFAFKPVSDPSDPAQPRTSAHLLLQGASPQDIDLGKFAGKPDVVNAAKAKLAGFPSGMLLGFRSYQATTGTSFDLAVLPVQGRYLRIVQRRVEEAAPEAGEFKTAREITLPANTTAVAAPVANE